VPFSPPADVPAHLVGRIESAALDKAVGEAERHRRVVGPLPRLEPERTAPHHVVDRLELTRPRELERRAQRVADRKSSEAPNDSVANVHQSM
jgi:hypothetical protein